MDTRQQFEQAIRLCRDVFLHKLTDYGASWRIMRPSSVTDQLLIKANRIRSLETKGESRVDEGIRPEFIAIVNYGIIGLIQLETGVCTDAPDMPVDTAVAQYDKHAAQAEQLMFAKNHDYDEAWRKMRISSCTDLILTKIYRVKQIENNEGQTLVSEGVASNYVDMINYALFALIKIEILENA
jgi:hypothetical protein